MHRVLFVIDSLFPLGATRGLISRALDRAENGHEVHLAVPCDQRDREWIQNLPFTLHELPAGTGQRSTGSENDSPHLFDFTRHALQLVIRLAALIRDLNPEAVEACGEQAATWTGLAAMRWTALRRKQPEWINHLFCTPSRHRSPLQWLQRLSGFRFDKAIVSHGRLKDTLVRGNLYRSIELSPNDLNSVRSNPCFQLEDSITARAHLRERLGLDESTWIAGAVAPLIPRSRLKDLIWATDLLSVIRADFHFVIFGLGSQYQRLQTFARLTEAADRVHFLGEPEGAWSMFQGLDVFWQSHLHEPLAQNVLAAMWARIPVISVLGPGLAELIKHQQTGLGVNFGARDEFARWTKYLIEQAASAIMIRDQAREFVENRWKP